MTSRDPDDDLAQTLITIWETFGPVVLAGLLAVLFASRCTGA